MSQHILAHTSSPLSRSSKLAKARDEVHNESCGVSCLIEPMRDTARSAISPGCCVLVSKDSKLQVCDARLSCRDLRSVSAPADVCANAEGTALVSVCP